MVAGGGAGNPLGMAGGVGDAAVEGGGEFEGDVGTVEELVGGEGGEKAFGFGAEGADGDGYAGAAEVPSGERALREAWR